MQEPTGAPAFEEIYEAYAERVLNLAYRLTGNEEVARDLTQDIFIRVYEKLGTFEGKSHVYTWIYRIAVNHIFNHLKRERRYRWLSLLDRDVSDALGGEVEQAFVERAAPPSAERALQDAERRSNQWRHAISHK